MRKIALLTGTRSEYGLLKPIIKSINDHPDLELVLMVTGMHLSSEFGETINEIKKDGFKINCKIEMNPKSDVPYAMAFSIGKGIQEVSTFFKDNPVDILLVLGDRTEALAAVIAAAYMNIPIAHIHGGDTSRAGLDESTRHAITKFAHIHFPATKTSAERIRKMGEDEWRIYIVGGPCLDTILNTPLLNKEELEKYINLKLNEKYILLVQHPVTTEYEMAEKQITETLKAIKEVKQQTIIIYPNSDAGGRKMIEKIKECSNLPFIKTFKSLSHKAYLSLMKYSSVMVGNSSSGIIESSSFKLLVINIGIRQEGRERAKNVMDVVHNFDKITELIKKALNGEYKETLKNIINPYGDGNTSKRITNLLLKVDIGPKILQKKITY